MATIFATKYALSMTEHPYGHGFYEPELASVVWPGTCGYLNRLGQWQPIADLTNKDDLDEKKLKHPVSLTKAPGRKHQWGPKCSNAVRQKKLGANVAGSGAAAGIPVEAAVALEFWSLTSFGALLLCPNKVNQQGYYHEDPFRSWARENAEGILTVCKDAKDYGFWAVTTTFSTDDVWINAWSSKETRVTLGFKTAVVEAGEVAPSGEFYRGDSASGWTHSEKEGDDEKVVFLAGLHFKYKYLPLGTSSIKEVRADEEPIVVVDPENPEALYQLEMEYVGKDLK